MFLTRKRSQVIKASKVFATQHVPSSILHVAHQLLFIFLFTALSMAFFFPWNHFACLYTPALHMSLVPSLIYNHGLTYVCMQFPPTSRDLVHESKVTI